MPVTAGAKGGGGSHLEKGSQRVILVEFIKIVAIFGAFYL
jgi:hypothetical protein